MIRTASWPGDPQLSVGLLVVSHDSRCPVQFGTGYEDVQGISEDNKVFGAVEVGALVEARQVDINTG